MYCKVSSMVMHFYEEIWSNAVAHKPNLAHITGEGSYTDAIKHVARRTTKTDEPNRRIWRIMNYWWWMIRCLGCDSHNCKGITIEIIIYEYLPLFVQILLIYRSLYQTKIAKRHHFIPLAGVLLPSILSGVSQLCLMYLLLCTLEQGVNCLLWNLVQVLLLE